MRKQVWLAALLTAGCQHPPSPQSAYLYPVCYFVEAPTRSQLDRDARNLKGILQSTVGNRSLSISDSGDGRWIVASVSAAENRSIADVWPRVACIGPVDRSELAQRESACVNYVRDFVLNKNYFSFGNGRDVGEFDIWHESSVGGPPLYCRRVTEGGTAERGPTELRANP